MPEELREGVGEHLFGCDDCQTVCPFNQTDRASSPRFAPHPRWAETSLADLLDPSPEAWARVSAGSPVHRATADGLARNAAIVLANRGDPASVPELERAAKMHPSAVVRDAAGWAATRIRSRNMLEKKHGS